MNFLDILIFTAVSLICNILLVVFVLFHVEKKFNKTYFQIKNKKNDK